MRERFSRIFLSQKMNLLAFLSLFTNQNGRFPYSFISVSPTLSQIHIAEVRKSYPFRSDLLVYVIIRSTPTGMHYTQCNTYTTYGVESVFLFFYFFFYFISFGITTDMGNTLRSICRVMNVSLCYHLHFLAFQFLQVCNTCKQEPITGSCCKLDPRVSTMNIGILKPIVIKTHTSKIFNKCSSKSLS